MKKIKKISIIIITILTGWPLKIAYAGAPPAADDINILDRLNNAADAMGFRQLAADVSPQERIAQIIGLVLSYLLGFLGVIFMILMIYAGFMWMTSHGNEEQVTKAKNTLKSAAIGLVIVVVAYALVIAVNYIIESTGVFRTA